MSERGSFVTQYIYCEKCLAAAKDVLLAREKHLCSTALPTWQPAGEELPIIAGKIGGSYGGEEIVDFETEYAPRLAATLCHPMRVAVLAEQGERIFTVTPTEGADEKDATGNPLVLGAFYWVWPTLDQDGDDWEREIQPARYAGAGKWTYLGIEGDSDWPVIWVGARLNPPL